MIDTALLRDRNLWNRLKETELPIVMYGMGNGADKILDVLDALGIEVADFFASDGFVRGHSFHGKRVLSFSEIKQKYEN
ncbi:MAG: FkbM family methyltransferase, partial [Clostridia bacterium]|nr:FkbM family methyltransferase [Clostridia bacterium]